MWLEAKRLWDAIFALLFTYVLAFFGCADGREKATAAESDVQPRHD